MSPQAGGDFAPLSFLMTTSFANRDFRDLEAAVRSGDRFSVERAFDAALAAAPNRKQFLLEHSLPIHERRHFFDLLSTPFGMRLFRGGLEQACRFARLVHETREKQEVLRLPLRAWAAEAESPAAIRQFVSGYDDFQRRIRPLREGEPITLPLAEWPGVNPVECVRLETDGKRTPHVGYRDRRHITFYPLNPVSVIEGLAVAVQMYSLGRVDPDFERQWFSYLVKKQDAWFYTAALRLARGPAANFVDAVLQLLEFGLMTPFEPERFGTDEGEPGSRFYALVQHLLTHPRQDPDINTAAIELCAARGWQTPAQVLVGWSSYLDKADTAGSEVGAAVLASYRKMAEPLLEARADEPLLGFRYVLLTGNAGAAAAASKDPPRRNGRTVRGSAGWRCLDDLPGLSLGDGGRDAWPRTAVPARRRFRRRPLHLLPAT